MIQFQLDDSTWALPYWDYTKVDDASSQTIPEPFRSPTEDNALYTPEREPLFNDASAPEPLPFDICDARAALEFDDFALDGEDPAQSFGGGVVADVTPNQRARGSMELTPHGLVHGYVGGETGLMAQFHTAGLDPLFWLHHCNLDRLWQVWIAKWGTDRLPQDSTWLGTTFRVLRRRPRARRQADRGDPRHRAARLRVRVARPAAGDARPRSARRAGPAAACATRAGRAARRHDVGRVLESHGGRHRPDRDRARRLGARRRRVRVAALVPARRGHRRQRSQGAGLRGLPQPARGRAAPRPRRAAGRRRRELRRPRGERPGLRARRHRHHGHVRDHRPRRDDRRGRGRLRREQAHASTSCRSARPASSTTAATCRPAASASTPAEPMAVAPRTRLLHTARADWRAFTWRVPDWWLGAASVAAWMALGAMFLAMASGSAGHAGHAGHGAGASLAAAHPMSTPEMLAAWAAMVVAMMLPLVRGQARWLALRSLRRLRQHAVAVFAARVRARLDGCRRRRDRRARARCAARRSRSRSRSRVAACWHCAPARRRLLRRCAAQRAPAVRGARAVADWGRARSARGRALRRDVLGAHAADGDRPSPGAHGRRGARAPQRAAPRAEPGAARRPSRRGAVHRRGGASRSRRSPSPADVRRSVEPAPRIIGRWSVG